MNDHSTTTTTNHDHHEDKMEVEKDRVTTKTHNNTQNDDNNKNEQETNNNTTRITNDNENLEKINGTNNNNKMEVDDQSEEQEVEKSKSKHFFFVHFTQDITSNDQLVDKLTDIVKRIQQSSSESNNNNNNNNIRETLREDFQQFLLELCWVLFYKQGNMKFEIDDLIQVLERTRAATTTTSRTSDSDMIVDSDGNDTAVEQKQQQEGGEGTNASKIAITTATAEEYDHHWPFHDASLVFLDVLSIFDCQHIIEKKNLARVKDQDMLNLSSTTVSLIQQLLKSHFITLNEMKIYLSAQSLSYNQLFPSSFNDRKFVILKTRHFYQQKRYNLFNEETEGYSKLLTELLSNPFSDQKRINSLREKIQSLIGYFDLDPNRVFDLVLDTAEIFSSNLNFLDVLSLFNKSNMSHIVGFKFRFYREKVTPTTLLHCAATLIKNGEMTVENLYPHLYPENDIAVDEMLFDFITKKTKEAQQVGAINLNQDSEETAKPILPRDDSEVPYIFENNQKLGLIIALLDLHACHDAMKILDSISSTLPPAIHPDVSAALCRVINWLVEPIYARLSPSRILQESYDPKEQFKFSEPELVILSKTVFPLLHHLGPELYHDLTLFTKLVRIVNEYIIYYNGKNKPDQLAEYLSALEAFLSALCFMPVNPGLVYEIWSLFQKINYEERYGVFLMVKQNGYESNYKMIAQYNYSAKEIKSLLRRLSKDNTKTRGRTLARIAHSNPMVVCEKICEICENYDNQIPVIVDALRYVSPLFHDVMNFCIIQRLTMEPSRPRLKNDASSIAAWLANLATLVGHLFKKFSTTDLEPLINYVLNQVKQGGWEDLVILRELIQHMSGIEIIDDTVSFQQLQAHAGGETLRAECGGFSNSSSIIPRSLRRSMNKLKETLLESGKGRMLLLLLGKLSSSVTSLHDESDLPDTYLKLVTDSHDKCHEVFMLLLRFFERNVPIIIEKESGHLTSDNVTTPQLPSTKILCLPNVAKLMSYGINSELAFAMVRKGFTFLPTKKEIDPTKREAVILEEIGDVTQMIPDEHLWRVVSKELYITFWSLDLYDIYVPTQTYTDRIEKLTADIEAQKAGAASGSQTAKKKEIEKLETVLNKLKEELRLQTENNQRILEYFRSKRSLFFDSTSPNDIRKDFMTYFCQYCIIPRCAMSSVDALYCTKFVELLHMEETPVFNTLQYLVKVTSLLVPSFLVCATEQEARRVAMMLLSSFVMIENWISSEEMFKTNCDKPGFRKFIDKEPENKISLKEFTAKLLPKIHESSTNKYLFYLNSDNQSYIRNSLIVLTNLGNSKVYPKYRKHVSAFLIPTTKLKEDKLENVKVLANRYYGILLDLERRLPPDEPPTPSTPPRSAVTTAPVVATPPASTASPPPSDAKPAQATVLHQQQKTTVAETPNPPSTTPTKQDKKLNPKAKPFTPTATTPRSKSPSPTPAATRSENRERDNPPPPPPKQELTPEELRKKLQESMQQKESKDRKKDRKQQDKSQSEGDGRRDSRGSKRNRDLSPGGDRGGSDSMRASPRDNSSDQQHGKGRRDNRDRDSRDSRDTRDMRDSRDRDSRDNSRDNRDREASKSQKSSDRDHRERKSNSSDERGRNRDNRDRSGTKRDRDEGSNIKERDSKRRREEQPGGATSSSNYQTTSTDTRGGAADDNSGNLHSHSESSASSSSSKKDRKKIRRPEIK